MIIQDPDLREKIKKFIPPIILQSLENEKKVFDGIYQNFTDVKDEDPWNDAFWYDLSVTKLNDSLSNKIKLVSDYKMQTLLLLNLLSEKEPVKVLDFSGGTGFIYHMLVSRFSNKDNIFWHVADGDKLVRLGQENNRDELLSFSTFDFTKYPNIFDIKDMKFDLVFINTSIQYFPNYKEILQPLIDKKIEWFFLTRLLAGEIPQFTTRQTIGRKITPCTFLNFSELCEFFKGNGYKIIFVCDETFEDLSQAYETSIPEHYRIPYAINVLFRRGQHVSAEGRK